MKFKKYLSLFTALTVLFTTIDSAYAQEGGLLGDIKTPQQSSEYIFRSSPKESLISVQLLGAVGKPGIYYVPANTDLLKLLTLAGAGVGPANGDLSEILVRKSEPNVWDDLKSKAVNKYKGAYEVDAEKIIKYGGGTDLKLAQDDFVYVPTKSAWVSSDASRTITLVSVLLSIGLTALLIKRYSN